MSETSTRRSFLKHLGLTLAGGSGLALDALFLQATQAANQSKKSKPSRSRPKSSTKALTKAKAPIQPKSQPRYELAEWTGDDPLLGHKFRSGDLPNDFPQSPDKSVDFIIVGGGLGGLTAAHYLQDQDFLLLEQYAEAGGQSRGGSYQGIDYSWGPAYVGTVEGLPGELYSTLGISPTKVPASQNSYYWEKRFCTIQTNTKEASDLLRNFKKLSDNTSAFMKDLPEDPLAAINLANCSKLDSMPFSEVLKGFGPEFTSLISSVCRSATTGSPGQISALAGLYLLTDITGCNYVFKGGNQAIANALKAELNKSGSGRIQTGTFVWQIILSESGAQVLYSSADGQTHRASCKHVIIATPPMVAWRQVTNLDDRMKANLMPMKYGSYLVANFLLDKQILTSYYDSYLGAPFTISDVIIAETPYMLDKTYQPNMGSVLTVYQPWEPGSQGRTLLLGGNRQEMAKATYEQVSQLMADLDKHLKQIVLTRWGHAIVLPGLNQFARLKKVAASYRGPYSLAHSSTQGLPCVESAIQAGKFASDRAKQMTVKTSWLTNFQDGRPRS